MPFHLRRALRLFRLAWSESWTPRRRRVIVFLTFFLPLLALANTACLLIDRLLFPGFRRIRVDRPVFIVGHARSGTTLMHQLLTRDDAQFSWFMTYELALPSILQKKVVRALGRFDREVLGGAIEGRIRAWENRAFEKGRQMHPMSLTGPEEDEFVFAPTFHSSSLGVVFAYLDEMVPYNRFDDAIDPATRARLMRYYRECVQRQLYVNGENRIHLSKNPLFSGKVASLLEAFPDARFAVMVRNPFETIPSIQKMMTRNYVASGTPPGQIERALSTMGDDSFYFYRHPFEVLDAKPEARWTAVPYELLVANPRAALEKVYADLGLDRTATSSVALDAAEGHARDYTPRHDYSMGEFGLDARAIHDELEPLFERFGWPEPEPEPVQPGDPK